MSIDLTIDGAEAHVLEAALAIYRGELDAARHLGGTQGQLLGIERGVGAMLHASATPLCAVPVPGVMRF